MIATAVDHGTSPGYHEIMTVRWAFRVRPGISLRLINRVFEKLVKRHDSLRLQFVQQHSEWKAEILAKHPTGVSVHDLSTLSASEQNDVILETARHPMTALSDPLFEMHLFRCGDAGDVVLTRAHHSIIDGYGVVVLIEDLIKFVINIPIMTRAVSHEQFIKIRETQTRQNAAQKTTFWENRLLPPPRNLNIGRVAKNLPRMSSKTVAHSTRLDDILTPEQSGELAQHAKKTGSSTFAYLHAAFSNTLCDLADSQEILVSSVIGRQNAELSTFIGAEMQEMLTRVRRSFTGIDQSAAQVSKDISEAAQALPTDIFFSQESRLSKELAAADINGIRFFVHILNPIGRMSNSPFHKLFSGAMSGKVSFGGFSIERFDLPGTSETISELFLSVHQTQHGPNASLVADSDAFDVDGLDRIAKLIREQFAFLTV